MKDLKITDSERISIKNGDFETVEEEERIKQQIRIAIKILLSDWVLDYRKGVDIVGGLRAYPDILKAQIKRAINEVWGVDRVIKYNFDDEEETYKVVGVVLSGNNEIAFEGAVGV